MPQKAWSKKRERQYEHIKEGLEDQGRDEDTAEEIAARTVNKERARAGEADAVEPDVDRRHLVRPSRRPALAPGPRWPDPRPALRRGQAQEHQGPLEDEQGAAREGGRPLACVRGRTSRSPKRLHSAAPRRCGPATAPARRSAWTIVEVGPGRATLRMTVREDMVNGHAIGHGGLDVHAGRLGVRVRVQLLQPAHGRRRRARSGSSRRPGSATCWSPRRSSAAARAATGVYDVTVTVGRDGGREFVGRSEGDRRTRSGTS